MKARDLVPNWPRGRTTETVGGGCAWKAGWMWYPDAEWLADHEADVEYHRQQQKMLWDFLEKKKVNDIVR